ncbi:uncharacterized protein [Amphiura filiformis]|uniref:uncharacterized protein n=1 Tax=Amphiura filiformis TaxID=82378 RepID=UPI003B216EFF
MGQLHSRRHRFCPIDILSDDALLAIFAYLPIPDKVKAERVCQKWKDLLRHPSVWRAIDFTQISHYLKPMYYADKQAAVLHFLQQYAGLFTKQVRLQNFASNNILQFLHSHCTQLEGIALFLHAGHTDVNLDLLSDNLTSVDLRLPISGGNGTPVGKFGEKQFNYLLHLNLHGVQITDVLCSSLSHSESLRYLMLYHCVFKSQSGSKFAALVSQLRQLNKLVLAYCWFASTQQLEEILHNVADNCCKLETFDFRFPYVPAGDDPQDIADHEIASLNFDYFLQSSVQMDRLFSVSLSGISSMTSERFTLFLQQHSGIQTLELSSCHDVDDDILYSIATNLTRLKSFQLRWCDSVTNIGLKYLAHHSSLQNLSLACNGITGKAVLTTVCTLTNIRFLSLSKVHGYKNAQPL